MLELNKTICFSLFLLNFQMKIEIKKKQQVLSENEYKEKN
jgi:hypothetical protein